MLETLSEQIKGGEIGKDFGTHAGKEKLIQVFGGGRGRPKNMPLESPSRYQYTKINLM